MADTHQRIVILDCGSQYTQLIARKIRESNVYCEVLPYDSSPTSVFQPGVVGIIVSGGPFSVFAQDAPRPDPQLFQGELPLLGVCYGCQLLGLYHGVRVEKAEKHEYGAAELHILDPDTLFHGFQPGDSATVWMSHGDFLPALPAGFVTLARTDNAPFAAIAHPDKNLYGVQFHPEVTHTSIGRELLDNFIFRICGCRPDWTPEVFISESVFDIRKTVGSGKVLCALSGGVDSAVVAMLLQKAVGSQLLAVFVDNGLLRYEEAETVRNFFQKKLGDHFIAVDARDRFLDRLKGVINPEKKRKIIGETFIRIFEEEAGKHGKIDFLAQGTLYPDVIESTPVKGPSATIKSHHNVGGLPEKMRLKLVEPVRNLFKDEVRKVGLSLGLSEELVHRQPFPGPGLAIRIPGEVTRERVAILQHADKIVREELARAGLMREIWQAFAVLLPVRTVGVMGDERTYGNVCAVRAVTSTDAMTADWARLPYSVLGRISSRIANEVKGINRVVYDISSKPPATIEWE